MRRTWPAQSEGDNRRGKKKIDWLASGKLLYLALERSARGKAAAAVGRCCCSGHELASELNWYRAKTYFTYCASDDNSDQIRNINNVSYEIITHCNGSLSEMFSAIFA